MKEEQTIEDEIGLIGNEEDPLVTRFSIASGVGSGGDGLDVSEGGMGMVRRRWVCFIKGCGLEYVLNDYGV